MLRASARAEFAAQVGAREQQIPRGISENMDLSHQSDSELLKGAARLIGSCRELTAELIAYLGEIEERRLHLAAGFSSMFEFCIEGLKLSEGEAFRRILAARLNRRFPIIYFLLASGRVHLSALELLREHLTEENHVELLENVVGKSKQAAEELLAARFPRPDAPSRIRPQRSRMKPLSEARYKVEFTASSELKEKLERCRDLMSHANPSLDLAVIVEKAVDLLLSDLERKKLCKTKHPKVACTAKLGRIANTTRREVFERDGLQCTYVSHNGRRCSARTLLELDHIEPKGLGGSDEANNLRVRCRAHNQLAAEQAYGREHVDRHRHLRQQKWHRKPHREPSEELLSSTLLGRALIALKSMGFGDADAQAAVDRVRGGVWPEPTTLEQAVREALRFAVPAKAG